MQIDAVGFFHVKKGGKRIDVARKNKRVYGTNIYQDWVNSGRLPEVLAFISECAKKLVSQKEMCQVLKINPNTFSSMKKDYPIIQETIDKAKYELKKDLASAMYKKAVGYETVEEDQYIVDKGGQQVKKVHRTKKQVGPDYKALTYLMVKHFGKEYSERYEELAFMAEQKEKANDEEWQSADSEDEEDIETDDGSVFL